MATAVAIYSLRHPETGEIRYIGKSVNPENRLRQHIQDSKSRRNPVHCWIQSLTKVGLTPQMQVVRWVAEAEWQLHEIELIALHRKSGRLLNVADGGEEPMCTIEVRRANGAKGRRSFAQNARRVALRDLMRRLGCNVKMWKELGNTEQLAKCRQAMTLWRDVIRRDHVAAFGLLLGSPRLVSSCGIEVLDDR